MGWHISKPVDGYNMKSLNINNIATATLYGYTIDYVKVAEQLAPPQEEKPVSSYIGNVGDKIDMIVTLDHVAYWENKFRAWEHNLTYLYNFIDENGNVLVWQTSKGLGIENGAKVKVTGTIKEHNEYKEVKQTVLTRCKIQGDT
jgi:hypothetical protein